MNATHDTKTKRLIAALGVTAAAAVTPAVLFIGAGTAHAEPCSSYEDASCSPFPPISNEDLGSVAAADPGGPTGGFNPQPLAPLWPQPQPVPGASAWSNLPQENPISAIFDGLGIERGW